MTISLTINGNVIQTERGKTVLQVAREHDVFIPTLCDYPGLPAHGSCRLCIVEVKGRPTTPTACTTLAEDGMVVETDTPQVKELRQELLRMLLAEHPAACLFCPEHGHCLDCMVTLRKTSVTTGCRTCPADHQCEFQEIIEHSELEKVAYPVRYRALPVEKEDPFFDRDYNLCVLCGRCIRVCESLHFVNIPAYVQRGGQTRVGTSFGQSHIDAGCTFCGACVDACPTGALWDKTRKWDGKPDKETVSTCSFCSLGCDVRLLSKGNGSAVPMILGSVPADVTKVLCVKGRFAVTEMVNHPGRLKGALHIQDGHTTRTDWEHAVQAAAGHLADCNLQDFGMLISASASSEALYVARKFAREVMGSDAVLTAAARYQAGLDSVKRLLEVSQPLEALDTADLILNLGLDARYAQSIAEVHLKRAFSLGAKVVTLHAREHVPGRFASLWLRPEPGEEQHMLDQLAKGSMDPPLGPVTSLLQNARKPVLLVGPDFLVRMPAAVERLLVATGAALVAIPAEGNLAGALHIGYGSAALPSTPRVLYLVGAPVPEELVSDAYIIFQNTHKPALELSNGLQLPMAGYGETEGSLLDQAGRVKPLSAAVPAPGDALPDWQILCRIARAMGKTGFDYSSAAEIAREMELQPPEDLHTVNLPAWVEVPGEHEFMGADLADWVAGLGELGLARQEEKSDV